jgi:hypothetical protein
MAEQTKKSVRKAGRTLVIKTDSSFSTNNLKGLQSNTSIGNNKVFLLFDNVTNSKNAFINLRKNKDLSVRYAYYRVFFTMTGFNDSSDYGELKKNHSNWIESNTGANVLYYKHYKKDNKLIGCGDFTIDSKEAVDKLLSKDGLRTYTFGELSGSFYKYNKKTNDSNDSNESNDEN